MVVLDEYQGTGKRIIEKMYCKIETGCRGIEYRRWLKTKQKTYISQWTRGCDENKQVSSMTKS